MSFKEFRVDIVAHGVPFGPVAEVVDSADVVRGDTLAGGAVDSAAEKPEFVTVNDFRGCPLGVTVTGALKNTGDTVIDDASDKGGLALFVEDGELFHGFGDKSFVKGEKFNAEFFQHFINAVEGTCGTTSRNNQIVSDGFKEPFFFAEFGKIHIVLLGKNGSAEIDNGLSFCLTCGNDCKFASENFLPENLQFACSADFKF